MPHKHTRRKGEGEAYFNLPPATIARPLPTFKATSKSKQPKTRPSNPSKSPGNKIYAHDDTPRAFTRLITGSARKRLSSSLDDGDTRSKKKRKQSQTTQTEASHPTTPIEPPTSNPAVSVPTILPGERLGDYAARVDHALPLTGLARKGKVSVNGMKERQTRTEKRLQRMYAEWRSEEARRKERVEEEREKEEDEEEEREVKYGRPTGFGEGGGKGKKNGRTKVIGEVDDEEDPWAELKVKREERKGLHDVVQAPPVFKVVPKEKFKVRDGAKVNVVDVPSKAGSLKKREKLGEARREVIERYRAMMKKKS